MLTIERFVCNMFGENTYVISDESGHCLIIDCGALYPEERNALTQYIRSKSLTPVSLLTTHGHLDHNFGNAFICEQYGLHVMLHADDEQLITNLPQQAAATVGMTWDETDSVGKYLRDGDEIILGKYKFEVIHTPGHTPGGAIYYCADERVAFTGDTLFRLSVGRTDFPGGSWEQLQNSLQVISKRIDPRTTLLTGHGESTTMEFEIQNNPYMKSAKI